MCFFVIILVFPFRSSFFSMQNLPGYKTGEIYSELSDYLFVATEDFWLPELCNISKELLCKAQRVNEVILWKRLKQPNLLEVFEGFFQLSVYEYKLTNIISIQIASIVDYMHIYELGPWKSFHSYMESSRGLCYFKLSKIPLCMQSLWRLSFSDALYSPAK